MRCLWGKLVGKTGQTLVEYALILSLVVILIIVALSAIGEKATGYVGNTGNAFP